MRFFARSTETQKQNSWPRSIPKDVHSESLLYNHTGNHFFFFKPCLRSSSGAVLQQSLTSPSDTALSDRCLIGIYHALFSSDARHCPLVKSKSVCSHDSCVFCPTVVRQRLIVDLKEKKRKKATVLYTNVSNTLLHFVTVKHIIERVDLVEVRKKYFEKISLYWLFFFPECKPRKIVYFLKEIGVFYKIWRVL